MKAESYEFEGFTINAGKRVVTDPSGGQIRLGPKAFDTLLELVRRRTEIVSRDDLLESVWPDTIVEENNLTQCISALRKAFGDDPGEQRFIATVPGKGYKFVADVLETSGASDADGHISGIPAKESRVAVFLQRPVLFAIALIVLLSFGIGGYYIGFEPDTAGEAGTLRSIAVLPFSPIPGQPVNEAMQLGMTESLITQLGKSDDLQVRPLAATRKFASPRRDPFAAGKELGVDAVIDGSIQIADGRIRVTARLFRISDGRQLWTESYNENLRDLFSLQDSISARVADALRVRLRPGVRKYETEDPVAYELYLRGRVHSGRLVKQEVERGISYYEKAVLADPDYPLPYVGIAEAQRALLLSNDAKAADVVPLARAAAKRAVQLAPDLAEARSAQGMISFLCDWNWKEAETNLKRSTELDPNNAELLIFYAHLLSNLGRTDEALSAAGKARKMAPTDLLVGALEAQFLNHGRRGDEAIAKLRAVIDLNDNFWLAHHLLSSALADEGQYDEAVREAEKAGRLAPFQTQSEAFRAYALASSGRHAEARAILARLLERNKEQYVPPTNIAMVYASLGDSGNAVEYLRKGYDDGDVRMPFLKVERKWDKIRDKPGFKALVDKLNLN